MSRGAALVGALLVTLATPATWPLALAAFLIRGGIVLVVLPVVVLPTPVGFGNLIAPTLMAVAFGSISIELVALAATLVGAALAWLLLGGWLAAALEAEGARIVASDEEVADTNGSTAAPGVARRGGRTAARIVAARLIAYVPLVVVLVWGSTRLVFVAYRELTSPLDMATPIVLRVLRGSPEVVIAIVLAWMVGETIGAIVARRIVLAGDGIFGGLRAALVTAIRAPLATLVRFWLPTIVLVVILAPFALAVASAWEAVRSVLTEHADPLATAVPILVFVALWAVGLLLMSVICAWRAAVWTVAAVGSKGTFGGSSDRQPGDWRSDPSSANL